MQINFLASADGTPLTKSFRLVDDGKIEDQSYPMRKNFVSYTEQVDGIQSFYAALTEHAERGHCLLKGQLRKELKGESRKGQTSRTSPTSFLVLDLDFDTGWDSIESFLHDIYEPWADVSYIWQDSASAGIKYRRGLRGHLFLLLDSPISPPVVRTWLRERNLTVNKLVEQVTLNAVGRALKYPLDVSVNQNDKLIYIAPPILTGMSDPVEQRIQLVRKDQDFAPAPPTRLQEGAVREAEQAKVSELRTQAGMRDTKGRFQTLGDEQFVANPERAAVVEMKDCGEYIRVNLAGDNPSWGYWFYKDDPTLLRNFKEEPLVRLQDVDPDFFAEYTRTQRQAQQQDLEVIPFIERHSDQYYICRYDRSADRIIQLNPVGTERKLQLYCHDAGVPFPDEPPVWEVEFDPRNTTLLDRNARWINEYRPGDILRNVSELSPYPEVPPLIYRVIDSVCGNDDVVREHFLNWLACLFQSRRHLKTAWVFHGTQGTGKGLLRDKIIRPLIGESHVISWKTREFEDSFNEPLRRGSVLWLDEFNIADAKNGDTVMASLKEIITEDTFAVRGMRVVSRTVPNFNNIIIATNWPDPIRLPPKDRRFNVAPAQERKIVISEADYKQLDDELPAFASYLWHREADYEQARRVLENKAREMMIEAGQSSVDAFFSALLSGNIDWMIELTDTNPQAFAEGALIGRIQEIIRGWGEDALAHRPSAVPVTDLSIVYQCYSGQVQKQSKFKSMLSKRSIEVHKLEGYEKPTLGTEVSFISKNEDQLRKWVNALYPKERNLKAVGDTT